ncbi:hypothetical protein QTH87_20680 [Variovorax sp. J22P168]|uniref:hypothetical protein n=1 Tax=Variovorax jilinensis TaxID=3053513 RepID=UPI0025756BFA|nr:hypothetical protein [Variovorax sp. J22P168]MDM0014872.1 hypothetical protein [Variovorax sp. J22P168]
MINPLIDRTARFTSRDFEPIAAIGDCMPRPKPLTALDRQQIRQAFTTVHSTCLWCLFTMEHLASMRLSALFMVSAW